MSDLRVMESMIIAPLMVKGRLVIKQRLQYGADFFIFTSFYYDNPRAGQTIEPFILIVFTMMTREPGITIETLILSASSDWNAIDLFRYDL